MEAKFQELKKYLPFLKRMVRMLKDEDSSCSLNRQAALHKIRTIRNLLRGNERTSMENLLIYEQCLVKLFAKVELGVTLPTAEMNKSPQASHTMDVAQVKEFKEEFQSPTITRDRTRVLVSPEPAPECRRMSPENSLYQRRSHKNPHKSDLHQTNERKKERLRSESKSSDSNLDTTLQVPGPITEDIFGMINGLDIDMLKNLKNQLFSELDETGVKEDTTDLIIEKKSNKDKKRSVKKIREVEEGELSESESEARVSEDTDNDQESEIKSTNKPKDTKTEKMLNALKKFDIVNPNELTSSAKTIDNPMEVIKEPIFKSNKQPQPHSFESPEERKVKQCLKIDIFFESIADTQVSQLEEMAESEQTTEPVSDERSEIEEKDPLNPSEYLRPTTYSSDIDKDRDIRVASQTNILQVPKNDILSKFLPETTVVTLALHQSEVTKQYEVEEAEMSSRKVRICFDNSNANKDQKSKNTLENQSVTEKIVTDDLNEHFEEVIPRPRSTSLNATSKNHVRKVEKLSKIAFQYPDVTKQYEVEEAEIFARKNEAIQSNRGSLDSVDGEKGTREEKKMEISEKTRMDKDSRKETICFNNSYANKDQKSKNTSETQLSETKLDENLSVTKKVYTDDPNEHLEEVIPRPQSSSLNATSQNHIQKMENLSTPKTLFLVKSIEGKPIDLSTQNSNDERSIKHTPQSYEGREDEKVSQCPKKEDNPNFCNPIAEPELNKLDQTSNDPEQEPELALTDRDKVKGGIIITLEKNIPSSDELYDDDDEVPQESLKIPFLSEPTLEPPKGPENVSTEILILQALKNEISGYSIIPETEVVKPKVPTVSKNEKKTVKNAILLRNYKEQFQMPNVDFLNHLDNLSDTEDGQLNKVDLENLNANLTPQSPEAETITEDFGNKSPVIIPTDQVDLLAINTTKKDKDMRVQNKHQNESFNRLSARRKNTGTAFSRDNSKSTMLHLGGTPRHNLPNMILNDLTSNETITSGCNFEEDKKSDRQEHTLRRAERDQSEARNPLSDDGCNNKLNKRSNSVIRDEITDQSSSRERYSHPETNPRLTDGRVDGYSRVQYPPTLSHNRRGDTSMNSHPFGRSEGPMTPSQAYDYDCPSILNHPFGITEVLRDAVLPPIYPINRSDCPTTLIGQFGRSNGSPEDDNVQSRDKYRQHSTGKEPYKRLGRYQDYRNDNRGISGYRGGGQHYCKDQRYEHSDGRSRVPSSGRMGRDSFGSVDSSTDSSRLPKRSVGRIPEQQKELNINNLSLKRSLDARGQRAASVKSLLHTESNFKRNGIVYTNDNIAKGNALPVLPRYRIPRKKDLDVPPQRIDEHNKKIDGKSNENDEKKKVTLKEYKSRKEQYKTENKSIKALTPQSKETKTISGPKQTEDSTSKARKHQTEREAQQDFQSTKETRKKNRSELRLKDQTPPKEAEDSSPVRIRKCKRPLMYSSESDDNANNTSKFCNKHTKKKKLERPHTSSLSKRSEIDDLRIANGTIVLDTVSIIEDSKKSEKKVQTLLKHNEKHSEACPMDTKIYKEQTKAKSKLLPDITNVAQLDIVYDSSSFHDNSENSMESNSSKNGSLGSILSLVNQTKIKELLTKLPDDQQTDHDKIKKNLENIHKLFSEIKETIEDKTATEKVVKTDDTENSLLEKSKDQVTKGDAVSSHEKQAPQIELSSNDSVLKTKSANRSKTNAQTGSSGSANVISDDLLPLKSNESSGRNDTVEKSVTLGPVVVFHKINKDEEMAAKTVNFAKDTVIVEPPRSAPKFRTGPKSKTYHQAENHVEQDDFNYSMIETTNVSKHYLSVLDDEAPASSLSLDSVDLPNEYIKGVIKAEETKMNDKTIEEAHPTEEPWSSESEMHKSQPTSSLPIVSDWLEPDWDCFTDKYYCFSKEIKAYKCRLCGVEDENIVKHYKKHHPHYEIPLSRMNPLIAKEAINESKKINFQQICKVPLLKYVCRFCFTIFDDRGGKNVLEAFFRHVVIDHTGEYKQLCAECTDVKTCTLMLHIPTPPLHKNGLLVGYICGNCNFAQVSLENLKNHVKLRHGDKKPTVYATSFSAITQEMVESLSLQTAEDKPKSTVNYDDNKQQINIKSEDLSLLRPIWGKIKIEDKAENDIETVYVKREKKDETTPSLEHTVAIAEELPSKKILQFLQPHFKVNYTETGNKEYVCCINGDEHYRTSLHISMKNHLRIKHDKQQWDGYCCLCKVIVMPPCVYDFEKLLEHLLETHMGNFQKIEETPEETPLPAAEPVNEVTAERKQESPLTQLISQAPPAAEGLEKDNLVPLQSVQSGRGKRSSGEPASITPVKLKRHGNAKPPETPIFDEPVQCSVQHFQLPQNTPVDPGPHRKMNEMHCEVEELDSKEALCQKFGAFCEPHGLNYKCPLCKQATEDSKEAMKAHLCEELKYKKWGCSVCSYKAFHRKGLKDHAASEHRQNLDPLELPSDRNVEAWIAQLLKHQEVIIQASRDNLQKQNQSHQSIALEQDKSSNNTNKPSTSQSTENATKANVAGMNVKDLEHALGKFGMPSEGSFACPKCDFTAEGDKQLPKITLHLINEIDKFKWRCSICQQFFQLLQEAQLHCERLHPGQAARADHTICDPDLRNEWIKRVLQTQREILENSNPTVPEAVLSELEEPPTREPDPSLLVPSHEETAPTPDDHFATLCDDSLAKRKKAKRSDSDDKRSDVIDELQPAPPMPGKHKCPHCEFRSLYQSSITVHIYRHFNLKPYICAYCNNFNGHRTSLERHHDRKHPYKEFKAYRVPIPKGKPTVMHVTELRKKKH